MKIIDLQPTAENILDTYSDDAIGRNADVFSFEYSILICTFMHRARIISAKTANIIVCLFTNLLHIHYGKIPSCPITQYNCVQK